MIFDSITQCPQLKFAQSTDGTIFSGDAFFIQVVSYFVKMTDPTDCLARQSANPVAE